MNRRRFDPLRKRMHGSIWVLKWMTSSIMRDFIKIRINEHSR